MHTTNHRDIVETTPENLIDFIVVNPFGTPGFEELVIGKDRETPQAPYAP